MKGVTQSLAGRAAIFSLLPFSYSERVGKGNHMEKPPQWLLALAKVRQTRVAAHELNLEE